MHISAHTPTPRAHLGGAGARSYHNYTPRFKNKIRMAKEAEERA